MLLRNSQDFAVHNDDAMTASPPADTVSHVSSRPMRWTVALLMVTAVIGASLRLWNLDARPLWVDEAESSINALTILQHGVPTDRYLGLPIHENVLIQPWPEGTPGSEEYEFRDSSYSSRGLAVYHGWLPLYSVAFAHWLCGIQPDEPSDSLQIRHDDDEITRRTIVPRLPAVFFGVMTIILVFFAVRDLYGEDAAWAAVVVALCAEWFVASSREARYYAATIFFGIAACWLIWRCLRDGGWRDFVLAALAFAALFHTHILTCIIFAGAFMILLPGMRRHRQLIAKLAVFGVITMSASVPWIVLTGFMEQSNILPRAGSLLKLPDDLLPYLRQRVHWLGGAALMVGWMTAAWLLRNRLPRRFTAPILDRAGVLLYLVACVTLGYLAFLVLIPAASFFYPRMNLALLGPSLMLGAILAAAMARTIAPRHARILAPVMLFAAVLGAGRINTSPWNPFVFSRANLEIIAALREMEIKPGTRLYSTMNQQLVLQYYTGLPFQSVMPIRRSFLDNYDGEILLVEATPRYEPLWPDAVQRIAAEHGVELSAEEAQWWAGQLSQLRTRREVENEAAVIRTPPPPDAPFVEACVEEQWRHTQAELNSYRQTLRIGGLMCRDTTVTNYRDWWQAWFYRFSGGESRAGAQANYASRIRNAEAWILPYAVIYRSPPPSASGVAHLR